MPELLPTRGAIVVPDPSLVVLVGPAGAGKSTFAARRFAPDEILSSDAIRAALTGDPADQSRNALVFGLLHRAAERRLSAGLLAVVDATNVQRHARRRLVEIGRRAGRPVVAIVLDLTLAEVLARNRARQGEPVPDPTVERQHRLLAGALARGALAADGFAAVHRLSGARAVEETGLLRVRPG